MSIDYDAQILVRLSVLGKLIASGFRLRFDAASRPSSDVSGASGPPPAGDPRLWPEPGGGLCPQRDRPPGPAWPLTQSGPCQAERPTTRTYFLADQ